MSAIKEFEETTAKITSAHQKQEIQTQVEETTLSRTTDEKGPIDYFNRTKETLRHVQQPQIQQNRNNNEHKSRTTNNQNDSDDNESEDSYVKIPVQQLINTFEKQMRSIIKQKINENIQLKMDGTTNTKRLSATSVDNDSKYCVAEKENEIKSNEQFLTVASRGNGDIETMVSQQQTINQIERQVSHSINEQYGWSTQTTSSNTQVLDDCKQSTILTSANNRFNNSNETQPDDHFDGGKA